MAHKYKKIAHRLQRHWDVSYSEALRACIDTVELDGAVERLRELGHEVEVVDRTGEDL